MSAMRFEATVAADGMVHQEVPGTPPGSTEEVSVLPKPDEAAGNGWPAGFHERMFGCATDEASVRHPQPELLPAYDLNEGNAPMSSPRSGGGV